MEFVLGKSGVAFFSEVETLSGVRKVADKVRLDVERVTDVKPEIVTELKDLSAYTVIYGTVGNSAVLSQLEEKGLISLSQIRGKREVYSFQLVEKPFPNVESAIVIAGSDKTGTIYGLFCLSELMGVSPLVDWSDVKPAKKNQVVLTEKVNKVSKEPSIKYRGIFINDEWPAFGNWTMKHFGGFTAEMYDHVFELILRLKGNYFWPAMWTSSFSCDGPGLLSAELAYEYGIVIGTSHHEPCIRHGEEYSHVRGKDSIYGDAWNFRSNREGIIKFWEDALKERGKLSNYITLGMRGERDSTILGEDSSLEQNIELLRDVLVEQNRLIKENVNENLEETLRCFVLYKEVEEYFYGNETTKGLKGSQELDGVTLMLSDDNFGNLRTMPSEEMLKHNGGYGLYYHFDYHGGPCSYEWVNSTYLPKVWEQLTMAYESGIKEIWVVNVGDLCFQEYPISYFMELAYDMEKWGTKAPNKTHEFTKLWIEQQFNTAFSSDDMKDIHKILNGYTRLNYNRKPEAMNSSVYHAVHYGEAESVINKSNEIIELAENLKNKCPEWALPAYYELVYFPACASANLQHMQVLATKNAFYAKQNRVEANILADKIANCIARDRELTEEIHTINNGKWYGMGLSEHIGFVAWNEEGNRYPSMTKIEPANKPRIIVSQTESSEFTNGLAWTSRPIIIKDFMRPDVSEVKIDISCGSKNEVEYKIETDCNWLSLSETKGKVSVTDVIIISIDRTKLSGKETGKVFVKATDVKVELVFEAENIDVSEFENMTFLERDGYIAIEAEHYAKKHDVGNSGFNKLDDYGRTLSAMKVLPPLADFTSVNEKPYLEYSFLAETEGIYVAHFYFAPSNMTTLNFGIETKNESLRIENIVGEDFYSGESSCLEWANLALNNIRIHKTEINFTKGINTLRVYAVSPTLVLERIVLFSKGTNLKESYLGAKESFYIKK